jgi:hypothetical protein
VPAQPQRLLFLKTNKQVSNIHSHNKKEQETKKAAKQKANKKQRTR